MSDCPGDTKVSNTGSEIQVGATDAARGSGGSGSTGESEADRQRAESERRRAARAADCAAGNDVACRPSGYEVVVVGFPDVTISDLVAFRPATPTLTGEPEGYGVIGMPTNVVATASTQELSGVLLGYPVTVRFTPVGYIFDYGDGTTARSGSGGTRWSSLGQPQFTPTATTHVYRARGTYSVTVTVEYAPAVNFGTGWRDVAGYVTATAGGYDVQVVEVRTALVQHTCIEDPDGPGC